MMRLQEVLLLVLEVLVGSMGSAQKKEEKAEQFLKNTRKTTAKHQQSVTPQMKKSRNQE